MINELLEILKSSERGYDLALISRAYDYAREAHKGVLRKSGEEYISHPIEVAKILAGLGLDSDTIAAALLHDVVEDTPHTKEELAKEFNADVAELVDGVTKLSVLPFATGEEQQAENVRKMLIAMAKDIRVIIIKLADRLHNMRTISAMPPHKQLQKARETMEIYAPISNRIGIRTIKDELEDICFRILDPYAYAEIEEQLSLRREIKDDYADYIKDRVRECLESHGLLTAKVDCRVKTPASIYNKVYQKGKDFDEVYDIYAVRVITQTPAECYQVFGYLSELWKPIPNRFKDYIQNPKSNMYQSIHNTYVAREGIPFEVQIRTAEMHRVAEYGIAAHWKYKQGVSRDKMEERLAWVRQILENQQEADDASDIVEAIKTDVGAEEVLALTPRGDVKSLPEGSTVIDFAYSIHSGVGHRMTGAKINGRIVPIGTKVKTGQVIEIITSKEEHPNRDWLSIAKTSEAKSKIRSWFKREKHDENVAGGRAELEREFARNRISLTPEKLDDFLLALAHRQHFESATELFAAIGYGGVILSKIMPRIKEDYNKAVKHEGEDEKLRLARPNADGIIIKDMDNCPVKISRCCNPLPGDDIIGFITRGHGVSVHKRECPNVVASIKDPENAGRWIKAAWSGGTKRGGYKTSLEAVCEYNPMILGEFSVALASFRIPVHAVNMRPLKNGNMLIAAVFTIEDKVQQAKIAQKLGKIAGVINIET